MMEKRVVEALGAVPPDGYASAIGVHGAARLLFLSGQVPVRPDGVVPAGIEAQSRQIWANMRNLLAADHMTLDNLVKVTVFLSERKFRSVVNSVSDEILAGRLIAWTTVVAGLLRDDWLIEIEAIAVA